MRSIKHERRERDIMKNVLGAAAILASGLFALPGAANAASMADAAALSGAAQNGLVETVHFRPYRHCHGPRWRRDCHGGRLFFFRDRDRDRRRYDRRDRDRRRGRDRD